MPELLEWFRVDRSRGTGRLLVFGAALVFVGASLVAWGVLPHHGADELRYLTLPGAGLLVVGLIVAIGGMTVLLAHDEYLAVRADGVLVHRASGDVSLDWKDLVTITYDATEEALIFESRGAPAYVLGERYSGVTGVALAEHLDELRRKAALGPLDSAQVARIALGLPHKRPT
jgi:hypothetical protein